MGVTPSTADANFDVGVGLCQKILRSLNLDKRKVCSFTAMPS